MLKKILFATDFSEASQQALYFASSLARDSGATLVIAHVLNTPSRADDAMLDDEWNPSEGQLNELYGVVPGSTTIPCEYVLLRGDPATKIVELAENDGVESIVMATHGHSRMGHLLAGSVTQAVMRRSHCAVIVFKPACHVPSAELR